MDGQKKAKMIRPDRVKITLGKDGEGEAKEQLPYTTMVFADLRNRPETEGDVEDGDAVPLKAREFEEVDSDNINEVMAHYKPSVEFNVEAAPELVHDDVAEGELKIDLTFEDMKDLTPDRIARAVPALARIMDELDNLARFERGVQGQAKVGKSLKEMVQSEAQRARSQGGDAAPAPTGDAPAEGDEA